MDVRLVRRAAGISQAALSVEAGIDRCRISFAENGYLKLSCEEQTAIRNAVVGFVRHQESLRREMLEACGISA